MAHTLLLVDDEPFNLELMSELLEDAGYQVQTAESGAEAWRLLEKEGDRYSSVLLDKMMPGMDGFEVLRRIKANAQLAFLPVIMQTAVGAAASVQEGLSQGAFYYLTKPFSREMLQAVVAAAVSHWDRHAYFRELANQQAEALGYLNEAFFTFRTHKEAQWVTAMLARACPHPERVATGLFELLVNAIEHGNLQLTYAEKTRLQAEGTWEAELERRLNDPTLGQHQVTLHYRRSRETISFTITDQGAGFDWQHFLDTEAISYLESHGRGILIARKLSFDDVHYQGNGNQVTADIWLIRPTPPASDANAAAPSADTH
ncbi:ATP-binding response regulator [Paludibacterium purpuratum]|uniref:Histidine kinase-like protein n=1 Tax=Paludibacterium purpuratum TaxID=1144873 RepID=A0A4R7AUG9_9NEIS|nr:response regulator [Paludibacterium purpuratum]TDR70553.1 histidine kinase-like protein [Paludibacterium purpuratum]